MKRLFSILLAAALMMACLSAFAVSYAAGYVYLTGNSNVRTGPGLGYSSIGQINSGSTVEYLNDSSYDNRGVCWYKIAFSGGSGWVSSKWAELSGVEGSAIYAAGGSGNGTGGNFFMTDTMMGDVYASQNVHVRMGPGLNYDLLTGMVPGDTAIYLGNSSIDSRGVTWYNISFDGYTGWVSSAFTVLAASNDLYYDDSYYDGYSSYEASGSTVEGVYGDSNVRTGPGLGYSSLGVLKKGHTAAYLGQQSIDERCVAWYKISFKCSDAWVSSRYTIMY